MRRSLSGARLQRRYCHHDRRGASLQSAPAGKITAGICRSDEQLAADQSENDGRGSAGQHALGSVAAGDRAARLGLQRRRAKAGIGKPEVALVDLREKRERERHGKIPSGLHLPYHDLQENVSSNGVLHTLAATGKILLFYRAFGERSAMAPQAA